MKKNINLLLFLIVFLIFSLCSCTKYTYFNIDENIETNIPLLNISKMAVLDLDEVERYDQKSLIPSTLYKGVNHQFVVNLQQRLMQLGYMEEDKPTTYYGESTESAIIKFERQLGFKEDGVCSNELYNMLMDKSAPSYEVKRGFKGNDIKLIQERLYELSYLLFDNDINGYFGEKTEEAIKSMQKSNYLKPDGKIGLKTYNLMYSDKVSSYTIDKDAPTEVISLYQKKLKDLGYYQKEVDGKYNIFFRDAVREFQVMNNQIANGLINTSTKFSIDSKYAKPFVLYMGMSNNRVKTIQDRLVELNYLEEKQANGYYGEYTGQAVAALQKNNNLNVTGIVDGTTLSKIISNTTLESDHTINSQRFFVMNTEDIKKASVESEEPGTIEDLIKIALIKLGSKYIWGNKGPNSFDCSGFVWWCLNQVGVHVDYMSTYNWRYSTQFDRVENFDDLQIGDLIIIDGHMGIVADNMTVIDASSSNGKVVHRNLDDWWRDRFLLGFRIFDS